MKDLFVIGDIHGKVEHLKTLLSYWNPDKEQLVFLGDLIDRGDSSFDVILLARELQQKYGAVVIGGNHEDLFLSWLDSPDTEADLYYPQGGRETIHSFFDQQITFMKYPSDIANLLRKQFPDIIQFLRSLPNYYEYDDFLMVHAGVNLLLSDWKNTSHNDFRWIRGSFHYLKNETGKIILFGHTPTKMLNFDQSYEPWISPCRTKIGIDGGAVFGGYLHGVCINRDKVLTVYSVDQHLQVKNQTISLIKTAHV